jgi:predicted MFS family arabinose efflux permease
MMGVPIALIFGYLAAGGLNARVGWRATFMLVGLPGVVLAAVAWLTLREPRVPMLQPPGKGGRAAPPSPAPPMGAALRLLWCNPTFRNLLFCYAVWYFFGYGLLQWQPTFFIRSHHLNSSEVGMWLALITGGGSLLGTYLGGEWGVRVAPKNERLQLLAVAVMFCCFSVFNIAAYLAGNDRLAFALLAFGQIGGAMAQGPILSTLQTLMAPNIRATALAVLFLFANLIGMGIGPLATGALSDALRPWAGADSLRYALVVLSPGYIWAAWHLLAASRTVASDMLGTEGPGAFIRTEVPSGA